MSEIEAVIPDMEDYHRMIEMILRHVAGYIYHYLVDCAQMPSDLVLKILDRSVDPALVAEAQQCVWDSKTNTVTPPHDSTEVNNDFAIDDEPWMDMSFMKTTRNKSTNGKKGFNIDDEPTIATMHPRNDAIRKKAIKFGQNSTDHSSVDDSSDDSTGSQPSHSKKPHSKSFDELSFESDSDVEEQDAAIKG